MPSTNPNDTLSRFDVKAEATAAALPRRAALLIERLGGPGPTSRLIGCHSYTCAKWATGESLPNAEGLIRLALATECDANWLLLGRGKPPAAQS